VNDYVKHTTSCFAFSGPTKILASNKYITQLTSPIDVDAVDGIEHDIDNVFTVSIGAKTYPVLTYTDPKNGRNFNMICNKNLLVIYISLPDEGPDAWALGIRNWLLAHGFEQVAVPAIARDVLA
jgi:hypothetical protein